MNKPTGGDDIPAKLFKILKGDTVKVLHFMSANLENSTVATRLKNARFHSNPNEVQCQRMFTTIPLSSFHMLAR